MPAMEQIFLGGLGEGGGGGGGGGGDIPSRESVGGFAFK